MYIYIYICIHIYMHVCVCVCNIYIYDYIYIIFSVKNTNCMHKACKYTLSHTYPFSCRYTELSQFPCKIVVDT